MSRKKQDDINIDDLTREELVAQIKIERKAHKRRIKRIKDDLLDTRLAHLIAIGERDNALRDLDSADFAIMTIVEKVASRAN